MSTDVTPPYGRSVLDRMYDAIERLPGPVWLFYASFFIVVFVLGFWFTAPNYPQIPGWLFTTISAYLVIATYWLRGVATRSVERVRPALDLPDAEVDRLAYRLAITPPRAVWIFLAIEVVYLPFYVFSRYEPFGYRDLPLGILIPGLVPWVLGETIGWILGYMTIRRLVLVAQVHRDLGRVDLFRQQPLHAFSALTVRSALAMLLLFGYIPLLSLGSDAFTDPLYLGTLVIGGAAAVLVAILPLWGMHQRIADEKRTRAMATGQRIEQALQSIATAVDAGDVGAIDAKQKALDALLTERDLIDKAHTWPWAPGTVRTLGTTVLVPVLLLVAGRVFDTWFR